MKTYFTTVLSASNGNFKRWKVEEVSPKDNHFRVLKQFKMLFDTFEAAEDEVMNKIFKEGGRYIQETGRPGSIPGTKRGPYKGAQYRSRSGR